MGMEREGKGKGVGEKISKVDDRSERENTGIFSKGGVAAR